MVALECPGCGARRWSARELLICWMKDIPSLRDTLTRDAIARAAGVSPARITAIWKSLGYGNKPHAFEDKHEVQPALPADA